MIGPHVIQDTAVAQRWAALAGIVKSIDRVDVLRAAPSNAVRVFRHYMKPQDTSDPDGTVASILAALGGYNHPKLYVELWNEVHPPFPSLSRAVSLVHTAGYKCCGATWGTGDYTSTDFDNAHAVGQDALAVHCYWGKQGFTIWEALRYRQFWRLGDKPILITECGRDAIEGGLGGWMKDGLTPAQYAHELLAYDAETHKDSYVLGATPFQAGNTTDWVAYNTDPVTNYMIGGTVPTPTPPFDVNKIYAFAHWQIAAANALVQTGAGNDPRSPQAFVEHLKALGADWQHPMDYGLPYVQVVPLA